MPWGAVAGAVAGAAATSVFAGDAGSGASASATELDAASAEYTRQQAQIAQELHDYWRTTFQPFETALVEEAKGYGSVEEQEREAGRASTTAALTIGKARDSFARSMASYGIDPTSRRFQDADLKIALEGAKLDAGSQNLARKGVQDTAFAKKFDIAALGKGLPASASAGLGSAATTSAYLGANQHARSQYEANLARQGVAPFVSLAQKGVSRWFNTPAPAATPMPSDAEIYGIPYGSPGSLYE
jgi:hypothetical protein